MLDLGSWTALVGGLRAHIFRGPRLPMSQFYADTTHLANNNTSHNAIKVYLTSVRQLHIHRGKRMPEISNMPRLN